MYDILEANVNIFELYSWQQLRMNVNYIVGSKCEYSREQM